MTTNTRPTPPPNPSVIVQEWNLLSAWYENSARMVITYPLLINASAAIALASFFKQDHTVLYLKIALFSFICGIIFGIITLMLEYITPFIAFEHFKKHFFRNQTNDISILRHRHDTYFFKKLKRISATIKIRLFNASLGITSCFIGIYCVANDLAGRHQYWITIFSILFIVYFVSLIYLVIIKLKPEVPK